MTEVPRMKHMLDSLCQLLFLKPSEDALAQQCEGDEVDHDYQTMEELLQECDYLRMDIADTITEIAS